MKKTIKYIKHLLNQERFNEILSRRTIIFLHIYKVGGNSFWWSLVKSLNNNTKQDFVISDSQHEVLSLVDKNLEGIHNQTLLYIKKRFLISNGRQHILHHHYYSEGFLGEVFPNAGIVVMIRKPEDRLRSAYRNMRMIADGKTSLPVELLGAVFSWDFTNNPLEFFEKPVFIYGLNHYVANLFNYYIDPLSPPPSYVINFIKKNFYFFTLNDFRSNNHKIKFIEKKLSISRIENLQYEGTITDSVYDKDLDLLLANNKDFSRKWNEFLNAEISWHKALGLDV